MPESAESGQIKISDLQVRSYALTDHASIEWRGNTGWAITDGFGNVLNYNGRWEWEPNPKTRGTPFVRRTRYDTAQGALNHYLAWGGETWRDT